MVKSAVIITIFLSFLTPFHGEIYAKNFDLSKAQQVFNKGEALYTENKVDRALEYYFAALDLFPFMSKAYYRIGVIYGPLRRKYKKGIEFFHKSIKYDSHNPNAYHGLGITYCMAGNEHLVLSQTKEKDRIEELARAIENRNAREFLSLPPVGSSK